MGGLHGMGAIHHEVDEPVFHAAWEGRVYALTRAMRAWGKWTLDAQRYAIELLPPTDYLRMSYYERWFAGLLRQVVKSGLVTNEEIQNGRPAGGTLKAVPALTVPMSSRFLDRGIPSAQDPQVHPRFEVGARVRARNINPVGHTRLPRYARGKTGTIARDHGVYSFPDSDAHDLGERRQHVYSVRFASQELWGRDASPYDFVHIDMWDDYLERAGSER
jgi:nitrile hydratase